MGERIMITWLGRALLAIVVAVAAAYPLADLMRAPLDDAARAALLRDGKAQQFVRLAIGTIHVRVSGPADGPVVLLVHGGAVGGYGYQHWQEPLARAGYRVVVPDLLGYGFSDRPDVPYTKGFYIAQLDQLLDALHIQQPVHIVGASMGGAIVTAFAAHAPARIKSVTLVAPAGGGQTNAVSAALLWPVLGDWAFRVLGPSLTEDMLAKAYAHTRDREGMAAWMADQTRFRGYAEGMLNTLRNYPIDWQPEDYEALGRTRLPVLAVWGTADVVVPFAQSRTLAARVPQVKLVALAGKGHALAFGETDTVLEAVIPFLKSVDTAAGSRTTPGP
jgi:pimeloyl-ACP methyl ester carboxylesterase